MPAKTTAYAGSLLSLIFNGTTYSGLATSAAGAGAVNNLYISLHTSSGGFPTDTSGQATFEAQYPSYSRQAVGRSTAGWTITGNSASPVATISFPPSTGSPSETEMYFGVGTSGAGNGALLYLGSISPVIAVTSSGIQPQLTTASTISES